MTSRATAVAISQRGTQSEHREHHEHRRQQQLVGGRIEHGPQGGAPIESLGEKAVRGIRSRRNGKQAHGRQELMMKQRERDRHHQQYPE